MQVLNDNNLFILLQYQRCFLGYNTSVTIRVAIHNAGYAYISSTGNYSIIRRVCSARPKSQMPFFNLLYYSVVV